MDRSSFLESVRNAGVVGEGGAGFPAHVKYDTDVDTVIANGCECEPLLCSDRYIMQTYAREIVRGLLAVMSSTRADRGVIGLKKKYAESIAAFQKAVQGTDLEIFQMDDFYPAGDEQILVYEATGKSIPPFGLPKNVGVVVCNVSTLYSVSNALDGHAVTHKIVTITGSISRPSILRVPVGTSLRKLVEHCGGSLVDEPVYIVGGPMMGKIIDSAEDLQNAVVSKTTSGVIVLPKEHYLHQSAALSVEVMRKRAATACIQCRYCTDLCPRYLIGQRFETHKVMRAFSSGIDIEQDGLQALMCSECGACELFGCPMRLSPRRINAYLKSRFREKGLSYNGPLDIEKERTELRNYRKIPSKRLAHKIGVAEFEAIYPDFGGDYTPATVSIPLHQHIGAPAVAAVKTGDQVSPGDTLGVIPDNSLGAMVHASIKGIVTEVGKTITIRGE